MPLVFTCLRCKNRYILTPDEKEVFFKLAKKEGKSVLNHVCPNCLKKETKRNASN